MFEIIGHKLVEREDNRALAPRDQKPESVVLTTVTEKEMADSIVRNGFLTLEDGTNCVVEGWRRPGDTSRNMLLTTAEANALKTKSGDMTPVVHEEPIEEVDGVIVPAKTPIRKDQF